MSNYEENPAGLGIGKRFGARETGGVQGTFVHNSEERQIVFDIVAGEPLTGKPMTADLPANYLVRELYLEVTEAFAATSGVNISIDGGVVLTAELNVATVAPLAFVALTGLTKLSGTSAVQVVMSADSAALGSATGKAKLIIKYKAV